MIALSLYWHFAIRYENIIMIHNDIQIIIMAGGVGSRFWPMSTPDYPKQFIDVMGVGRSLGVSASAQQGIELYIR
mgnify:CR=1 FL=1